MKKLSRLLTVITVMSVFLSMQVHSMSINSLMLINSEHKKGSAGVFTISNSDDITYFLKTSISEISVTNNKINKIPYDRSNISEWDIAAKPSKIVIEPKMVKELMIEDICGSRCSNNKDRVYKIDITPVSYETKDTVHKNNVSMLFGFAPYYIIPAKTSDVDYTLKYNGTTIKASNSGNTLIKLVIDQCKGKTDKELESLRKDKTKSCTAKYTLLSGRTREFSVPMELRKNNLRVIVLNHDETFREEKTL